MAVFVSLECVGTAEECKSGLRSVRSRSAGTGRVLGERGGGAHGGVHSEMPTGAVPIRISFARL
jgi:hypothetical protein